MGSLLTTICRSILFYGGFGGGLFKIALVTKFDRSSMHVLTYCNKPHDITKDGEQIYWYNIIMTNKCKTRK